MPLAGRSVEQCRREVFRRLQTVALANGLSRPDAHRAGLDLTRALESVSSGAAGSWALSNLAPRIVRGDFAPGFFVEHFLKDLAIVLEESRRMNLALPGVALAEQLYRAAAGQGHLRDGTQSLILALAQISGFDWQVKN